MIEKDKLYEIFDISIKNALKIYQDPAFVVNKVNWTDQSVGIFKVMAFQFCLELNKQLNLGASVDKEFTDKEHDRLCKILEDCRKKAVKNYKNPDYKVQPRWRWSKETIDKFCTMMDLTYQELEHHMIIRLKRQSKKRKKRW